MFEVAKVAHYPLFCKPHFEKIQEKYALLSPDHGDARMPLHPRQVIK